MRTSCGVSTSAYNAANQLTQWGTATLTYDANGNMTSSGTDGYTWDARNRLVSTLSGASFQYDPFGWRVNKNLLGTSTSFLYDGPNVVQELAGTTPTANLLSGGIDEVFTRTDGAGARNFMADGLGSTLALEDATDTLQAQYTYEPFGNTTSVGSSTNPFQYTGRENDGTGLYFYRARYHNPAFNRFISEDPLEFRGGDTNLYAYVWNSPLNLIDPFGWWGVGLTGGGSAGFAPGPYGAVGTASAGVGLFKGNQGFSTGGFAQAGGFAGFGPIGPRYPDGPRDFGSPWGFGAAAGVGGGFFLTNATSVCNLKGPFNTTLLTAGVPGLTVELQVGYSHGTWIVSLTGSPYGVGALLSNLSTNT